MIVFLFICIVFLSVLYSWIRTINDSKKFNLCGPFPLPVVGNGHLFFGDPTKLLTVLSRLAREYNDACRFYILSHRYVSLSHPKFIEPLLSSTELISKGRAYHMMRPWLGDGLLTSSGSKWKEQRKLLTPAFHYNILHSFIPVFLKNDNIFTAKLTNYANDTPINIDELFTALAFDNITESVMGISFDAQKQGKAKVLTAIEDLTHIVALRIRNPLLANELIFQLSPQKVKMNEAINIVNGYANEAIKSRRKILMESNITTTIKADEVGMKNKFSFLDLLLLADVNGERLSDDEILAEVNTFMFAGHDTVATALTFTVYCISNHKAVQDKIFKEQMEIFNGDMERDATYHDLMKMKYLELVIKESMRLYPSAPLTERLIKKNIDLAGLHLPKDTLVFINIYEMQRNPKVFTNPLEFIPERFNDNSKSPFSWIPFSAGPRNCIGQKYAMLEMKITLSSIVKKFLILPSGRKPIITGDMTIKSKNGVYVNLLPRNNNNKI